MKTHSRFLPPVMHSAIFSSMAAALTVVTLVANAKGDCFPARESPNSSADVTVANRELAIRRFQMGNALLEKQDFEGALDLFLRSRALWYHWANTLNAAICLTNLGRYHEALAFYEEILRDFPNDINLDEREQITKTIEQLEKRVLRIQVDESSGTLKVDSDVCGALPRAEAIYLLPGVHVFRILHSKNPERSVLFDGHAGAIRTVRLPPLPPPPPPPLASPSKGQWFVQASAGPAIGGAESNSIPGLSSMSGYLVEMRDGYRFANQLAVGLNMGFFYVQPKEDRQTQFAQTLYRTRPTLAEFIGISVGWDPHVDRRFASLFRIGIGVFGAQSKNVIEVDSGGRRLSIDDEKFDYSAEGRDIVYSVNPYAGFEMGLVWHVERIRVGFSVGAMFLLQDGPLLPEAKVLNRGAPKPFKVNFAELGSYQSSFLFLPQIVFEYDP